MKIAITRLREKAGKDAALCRKYGHECFTVSPLASEVYIDNTREFVSRVNAGEFDCLFFTSALPAQIVGPLLETWPRVIAIGPQTTRTLQGLGIECETLPAFYSRNFAPHLGEWLKGKNVGIPRADVPNPALLDSIRSEGGIPHETAVYGLIATNEELRTEDADAIIFTSGNSFSLAVWDSEQDLIVVAIGDITAERILKAGITPAVVGDGSLEGTLKALNMHLENQA